MPTWSGCILQLSLLFLNVIVDVRIPAACPFLYICPFPLVGSQLFARGVNLNWPIRAQSGTCSSRFQTDVDVEHSPRMVVLPYGRILFKFSTTKNGLVIILEVLYDGEFIWLYGNMIFMVICCSPLWGESILWSWYAENNCENGAKWPAFHFVLREEQLRREIA